MNSEGETTIKIACHPERSDAPTEVQGYIVPDTEGLLAIDERHKASQYEPARWFITHVPTGRRVAMPGDDPGTREDAALRAQSFFAEARKAGLPLASIDPDAIAKAHNEMPLERRRSFWDRVCGAPEVA